MEQKNNKKTSYQVLALRTRPQSFASLIGQQVVAEALSTMISTTKIPHAFLFTGTRGTGKTSSARILAKSLCCVNGPTVTPCQKCVHCKQITLCAHDDVLEIDGASNTGVDSIRELREAAKFYPSSAKYKIFIIDEVHMLSTGAFNALLKTLEEPPNNVIFILATTELHKIPMTVRSRCMILSFRKVPVEEIANNLQNILLNDNVKFEKDALTLIAREAKGSIRDSLSLLEQVLALCGGQIINLIKTKQALGALGQDIAEKLMIALLQKNICDALELIRHADSMSMDPSLVLNEVAILIKNALFVSQNPNDEQIKRIMQLLQSEIDFFRNITKGISYAVLAEIYRTLVIASREATKSVQALSWAEFSLIDCISKSEWLSVSEILSTSEINHHIKQASSVNIKSHVIDNVETKASLSNVIKIESNKTDQEAFLEFIDILTPLLPPFDLGRLKTSKIEKFNKNCIEINIDSQKIIDTLSQQSKVIIKENLDKMGYAKAKIIGLNLLLSSNFEAQKKNN